jgi:hypothetical protein
VTDSDVSRNEREEPKEVATTVEDHIDPGDPARGRGRYPFANRHVGSDTMKRFVIVLAIVLLQGCDAPWAGPTLPDGSHALNLTELSVRGPFDLGPGIIASTSLAQVRDQVISHAMGIRRRTVEETCQKYQTVPDPCWAQQVDRPGHVYVAVIINYECTSSSKDASAVGGHTLYYIHWVGNPQGVCSASMAQPNWRLYSASRSDLPSSGILTVRLVFQGSAQTDIDIQVQLT